MKENEKLINAVIELAQEMKGMRKEQQETNHRLENLEKQQARTNLELCEMRLSYMKVADEISGLRTDFNGLRVDFNGLRSDFNKYAGRNDTKVKQHETRIIRLEDTTFGKDDKRISMVKESNAEYKKKKKKLKK